MPSRLPNLNNLRLLPAFLFSAVWASAFDSSGQSVPAPLVLCENGAPRAEIVVAERRPRMTTLAALELRLFLQKMSGARLPIVTAPTAEKRLRIYVGQSPETDRLGVKADDLHHGAYRIVAGPEHLVLIGRDRDFDPSRYPLPLKRNDGERAEAEWATATKDQTDSAWGFPFRSGFKGFWNPADFSDQMTARYGDDCSALWPKQPGVAAGFWNEDQSGSLNAVCALLRSLGVRWFMPGDLGEVVPRQTTVVVSLSDETVRPDFALREWNWYNFSGFAYDDIIWARRLGMNSSFELLGPCTGPHGGVPVHSHPAMMRAHPDYYALLGGERDTKHRERGTPCFTSPGFEAETVNFLRFLYDRYNLPSADIWPCDGLRLCQCETCRGKSASDLVWGFADRVARKIHESHPGKRVTCGAYTSYVTPPGSIDKLSPNLAVWISNGGRPLMEDPEHWADYWQLIESWRGKVAPGNILRLENNRYHIWGADAPIAYPVLHPRAVAKDLKALKGVSLGDTGEQSQINTQWKAPALEHITLYVQSRFLWNAEQNVEQVLEDYCRLFYGPAAKEMFAAIAFAEQNLAYKDQSRSRGRGNPANVSLAVGLRLRELLSAAKQKAGDGVYGQRIAAILAELQPAEQLTAAFRAKDETLAQARASAPEAIAVSGDDLSKATLFRLKDNKTGAATTVATTFRAGWDKNSLLLEIVCQEPNMKQLRVSSDVHNGDNIAISIETPLHAYYHLEINPDGALVEGNPGPSWKSLAEVKTERGADFWRVQVRLPVVGELEAASDPRHRVAGGQPTADKPWFFNVGRFRVLDLEQPELQAFSPTRAGWHHPGKFGKLRVE